MIARLRSAIPFVLLSEKFFDVEGPALALVERANSLLDLGAELAELLDVREQSAADLLLIGVRQICHFGDCYSASRPE
jgi:hypothetical protein